MPALPKNVTGSSLAGRPWCETGSIFTVWPDLMASSGGRSAVRYPQITVSGVERSVASGVAFGGTVCAPADEARPAIIHATAQRIRISINEVRIDDLPDKDHGDDHDIKGRAFTVELKTVAPTCLLRNAGVQKIATATIASADACRLLGLVVLFAVVFSFSSRLALRSPI